MKKVYRLINILTASILLLVVAFAAIGQAAASPGKVNIKGTVNAVGEGTLSVESNKGQSYVFTVPDGFVLTSVKVGDTVLVKAVIAEDGTWTATTIKVIGVDDDDIDDDKDEDKDKDKDKDEKSDADGGEANAYCVEGQKEDPHPMAQRIAERYEVPVDVVMGYFCSGYSMGEIMLALKTSRLEGVSADVASLLASHKGGSGWGLIWQDLGLIGKEKQGHSPPGLLKKPDKVKKDKD